MKEKKRKRTFVMISAEKKDKKMYAEGALNDGFMWVASWFRWMAIKRMKQQAKSRTGDRYEQGKEDSSANLQKKRVSDADDKRG